MQKLAFLAALVIVPCTLVAESLAQNLGEDGGLHDHAAPTHQSMDLLSLQPSKFDLNSGITLGFLQDEAEIEQLTDESAWRVDAFLWVWMQGLNGDVGVRGIQTDVDASFSDILEGSDSLLAFSGRIEVGHKKWAVFIDGMYARIGADSQTGPAGLFQFDLTFEQTLIDFGLMYRIGEWEPTGGAAENTRDISLDLYAGARYNNIELELEPTILESQSKSVNWIDPIIGAKAILPFSKHWHIMANGDIGGFGANSDFTWSATAVIGFDFTLFNAPASLYMGYRAIGLDYEEGSGSDEFIWDVVQHGPILGFGLRF